MQSLKLLRKELGLSQKDFANLIGCNTGQLAMAETNMRRLSAESYQALLMIQTNAQKSSAAKAKKSVSTPNIAISNMLNKVIKSTKIKLGRQQIKEEAFKNKITAAENLLAFTALALQQKGLAELTKMQLTVLHRQAGEKLSRSQLALLNCKLQIAGLQAIITAANSFKKF